MTAIDHTIASCQLEDYRIAAAALAAALNEYPPGDVPACSDQEADLLRDAWAALQSNCPATELSELGLGELLPRDTSCEPLIQFLQLDSDLRQGAYQQLFGLVINPVCPPYETEYLHWNDPTYRAQQLADIAGFYKAFGVEPNPLHPMRQDFAAVELEFTALLLQKWSLASSAANTVSSEICRNALAHFIYDHIAWWMPTFGRCLELQAQQLAQNSADPEQAHALGLLARIGSVLRAWIAAQRIHSSVEPSRRIIAPQVDPTPPDQQATDCGSCPSNVPT